MFVGLYFLLGQVLELRLLFRLRLPRPLINIHRFAFKRQLFPAYIISRFVDRVELLKGVHCCSPRALFSLDNVAHSPLEPHTRSPFLPCNTCYFFYASFLAYCNMKVVKSTFSRLFPAFVRICWCTFDEKILSFSFFLCVCFIACILGKTMLIQIIFSNIVFIDTKLQLNCNLTLLGRKEIF